MIEQPILLELEPNWFAAPDWAYWWAVDADGRAFWYAHCPVRFDTLGVWEEVDEQIAFCGMVVLHAPNDWCETLRTRPDYAPGT